MLFILTHEKSYCNCIFLRIRNILIASDTVPVSFLFLWEQIWSVLKTLTIAFDEPKMIANEYFSKTCRQPIVFINDGSQHFLTRLRTEIALLSKTNTRRKVKMFLQQNMQASSVATYCLIWQLLCTFQFLKCSWMLRANIRYWASETVSERFHFYRRIKN